MLWFCKHKWITIKSYNQPVYDGDDRPGFDLPIERYQVIEQQCEYCGKQIVRKFRT